MGSSYNPRPEFPQDQDSEILTLESSLLLEQKSTQRPSRCNQLSASDGEHLQVLEKHSGSAVTTFIEIFELSGIGMKTYVLSIV